MVAAKKTRVGSLVLSTTASSSPEGFEVDLSTQPAGERLHGPDGFPESAGPTKPLGCTYGIVDPLTALQL